MNLESFYLFWKLFSSKADLKKLKNPFSSSDRQLYIMGPGVVLNMVNVKSARCVSNSVIVCYMVHFGPTTY
jgi:hypothetical protein